MTATVRRLLLGVALLAGPLCAIAPAPQEAASPGASTDGSGDGTAAPAAPQLPPRPTSLIDRVFPITIGGAAVQGAAPGAPGQAEPSATGGVTPQRDLSTAVEIVLLLTLLSLIPPLLLTVTCFTRVIVVLSFVRRAMSTPELPPNPVLIGLALFLTGAVMAPTGRAIHAKAIEPYLEGNLPFAAAAHAASGELKQFLLSHTRPKDVALFMELSRVEPVEGPEAIPLTVAIPAFIVSELRTSFQMGFLLYLPFLVIDLVVASVLLAMGMYMLPPMLVATPLKILLFVLVDGWGLVIHQVWKGLQT
jgi:flagellar biosynthetic protein FliP